MHAFTATLHIIGVNPYVHVPDAILEALFAQAGRRKGTIPICGTVNALRYTQTLVRFQGAWRLYINTAMLKNSPKRVGEALAITVGYDPADRSFTIHPKLAAALAGNAEAKAVFEGLRPSLRVEIVRYIARLKSEDSVERNVARAIEFLLGRGRFVGRDGIGS